MAGRSLRAWSLVVVPSATIACSGTPDLHLIWPSSDAEVVFFASVPPEGPVKLVGPVAMGGASPGPQRLEADDDDAVYFVGLSEAHLRTIDPRLRLTPLDQVSVTALSPACGEGELAPGKRTLPLPRGAEVLLRRDGANWLNSAWPAELSAEALAVPRDETAGCTEDRSLVLAPFLADALAPSGPITIDGQLRDPADEGTRWCHFEPVSLAWLDEERLGLLTACNVLYRHVRGTSFPTASPRRVVLPPPPSHTEFAWYSQSLAAAPRTSSTGADRLIVSYSEIDTERRYGAGALMRVDVEPNGRVSGRLIATSETNFQTVRMDADGRFVVSGRPGKLLLGHIDRGVEWELSVGQGQMESADFVDTGRDADGPLFVMSTTEGAVYVLRPEATPSPTIEDISPPFKLSTVRGFALRRTKEGAAEVWVGTYSDGLFRRALEGDWERIELPAPRGLESCAAPIAECGGRAVEDFFSGLATLSDGRLAIGPAACSAAVVLSPESSCSEVVAPTFEPLNRVERRSRFQHTARSLGGRVAFASRERHLLVMEPNTRP